MARRSAPASKRRVALAWGQAADRLHAAQEAERVGVGDDALLLDDAGKLGDVEEPDWQALLFEHVAPLGEALAADRGVDQHAAGGEKLAERVERGERDRQANAASCSMAMRSKRPRPSAARRP